MNRKATVSSVWTNHVANAICDLSTYVVEPCEGGWKIVGRTSFYKGQIVPVTLTIDNVPRFPGARDENSTFPTSPLFTSPLILDFTITTETVAKLFGLRPSQVRVERTEGVYRVWFQSGKPLGELEVVRWEDDRDWDEDQDPERFE
jgi:hypothetical protein